MEIDPCILICCNVFALSSTFLNLELWIAFIQLSLWSYTSHMHRGSLLYCFKMSCNDRCRTWRDYFAIDQMWYQNLIYCEFLWWKWLTYADIIDILHFDYSERTLFTQFALTQCKLYNDCRLEWKGNTCIIDQIKRVVQQTRPAFVNTVQTLQRLYVGMKRTHMHFWSN